MRLAAPEEDLRFTEPNVKWQEEQGESLIQPRLALVQTATKFGGNHVRCLRLSGEYRVP